MGRTLNLDRSVRASVDDALRSTFKINLCVMQRSALVLLGILALEACKTDRSIAPAVTRLPHSMCTTERPLGSHMPTRVCRSDAQIEADRKQAQETLNQVRKTPGGAASQQ